MTIRIKLGVIIAGLSPEGDILDPAFEAALIWREQGWGDVTITAGIDGNHIWKLDRGHYFAKGIDLGLPPDPAKAVTLLQARLPKWTVMLETNHIHVQKK